MVEGRFVKKNIQKPHGSFTQAKYKSASSSRKQALSKNVDIYEVSPIKEKRNISINFRECNRTRCSCRLWRADIGTKMR